MIQSKGPAPFPRWELDGKGWDVCPKMSVPEWYWEYIQPLFQWLQLGHLPQTGGILDQVDWYYILVPTVKRVLDADAKKRAEERTGR